MIKKVFGKKLSRSRPAREALFASLARAMILNGKIVTTRAKAKAVIGYLERMVTVGKKATLAGKRRVLSDLDNKRDALTVLYENVVPAFASRSSGYIRIIALPNRKGDNSQVVRMEWTEKVAPVVKTVETKVKKEDKKKVIKTEVKKVTAKAKK